MLLVLGALLLSACSSGGESLQTFTADGISFQYPDGWSVVGFSTLNSPHRLAASSYPVPRDAIEGDCGGYEAVELMPPEGALVLLIDNGEGASFPPRPESLTMRAGEFANYECFGESTMFRFRVGQRDIQAHIAVGSKATDETTDRALAILTALSATDIP